MRPPIRPPVRLWHALVFAALLPFAGLAEDAPAFGPLSATDAVLADQMFVKRPVVVFADIRQMDLLSRSYADLEERDVILVTDTDPAANSEWRHKLRPRGFSLVIMDKDLRPVIRKPNPWTVREITAAIDKLPLRRQEMLERSPAGR
jgi:Domain of unknown function (DUF4174)